MLADALCCPRCAGKLSAVEGGLGCDRCRTEYPMVAGMACMAVDPALWRTLWLRRLQFYLSGVDMRVSALHADASSPDLLPRTGRRLQRLADGLALHRDRLVALCQPLALGADPFAAKRSRPGQRPASRRRSSNATSISFVTGAGVRPNAPPPLGLIAPLLPEQSVTDRGVRSRYGPPRGRPSPGALAGTNLRPRCEPVSLPRDFPTACGGNRRASRAPDRSRVGRGRGGGPLLVLPAARARRPVAGVRGRACRALRTPDRSTRWSPRGSSTSSRLTSPRRRP